jgi:hypothetical protein
MQADDRVVTMLGPPIHRNRQHNQGERPGPLATIGSMSQERRWAYSRPSAVSLMSNSGPIQGNGQTHLGAILGPTETIGSVSQERRWAHPR